MLFSDDMRHNPLEKPPKRAGKPYYGKRTGFTDSYHAPFKTMLPKDQVAPTRKNAVARMKKVKEELAMERALAAKVEAETRRLRAKLEEAEAKAVSSPLPGGKATIPPPKGYRNGTKYYGRTWSNETRTREEERLRPARAAGTDTLFTVIG